MMIKVKKLFLTLLAIATVIVLLAGVTILSLPASSLQAAPQPQSPMASSPSYQLNWDVVSAGGSTMQSTSFTMYSTTGQNVTTTMSGSNYTMKNGFWQGVFAQIKLFLPLVIKA